MNRRHKILSKENDFVDEGIDENIKKKQLLTFEFHANIEALLEAAKWTALPLCFVYVAGSFSDTRVHLLVLNGPLEETLTGLAR